MEQGDTLQGEGNKQRKNLELCSGTFQETELLLEVTGTCSSFRDV